MKIVVGRTLSEARAFKENLAVSTITAPSRTMWTPAGVVDVLA